MMVDVDEVADVLETLRDSVREFLAAYDKNHADGLPEDPAIDGSLIRKLRRLVDK